MKDDLIDLAHPRARGYYRLDVTSFLSSQKDWDHERDNGWTEVEILSLFSPIDVPTPTYDITLMYSPRSQESPRQGIPRYPIETIVHG